MSLQLEQRKPAVPGGVFHYTVLRFAPDPIREEFVNVGLALVDDAGRFSKFDFNRKIERRLGLLGARKYADSLVRYLQELADGFDVAGWQLDEGFRTKPPLTPASLGQMGDTFASMVRLTAPRVFLADDPERAFQDLFDRHVVSVRELQERDEGREPERERRQVRDAFVRALRHIPNFSDDRIRLAQAFRGVRLQHWVDVVVIGHGAPSALAHALPFGSSEARDLFLHRGTLVEAAEDSSRDSVRLGLYEDVPANRADLLRETRDLFRERGIELYRRVDVGEAAKRFEEPLLRAE